MENISGFLFFLAWKYFASNVYALLSARRHWIRRRENFIIKRMSLCPFCCNFILQFMTSLKLQTTSVAFLGQVGLLESVLITTKLDCRHQLPCVTCIGLQYCWFHSLQYLNYIISGCGCSSNAALLPGSRARIPLRAWFFVPCVCCVLCTERFLRQADLTFGGFLQVVWVCVCVWQSVCECVCVWVCACAWVYVCECVWVSVWVCVCECVCVRAPVDFSRQSITSLIWYIVLRIFLIDLSPRGKYRVAQKMYTLFTHQYLWNKFKWNFYFRVRV